MARRTKDGLQTTLIYDEPTMFSLKFIHEGVVVNWNIRYYDGGTTDYFDSVDGEMLGLIELKDFAEQLGYDAGKIRFWHQFGHSFHLGSKILETDADVYNIVKYIPKNREVLIFLEHLELDEHPPP